MQNNEVKVNNENLPLKITYEPFKDRVRKYILKKTKQGKLVLNISEEESVEN